MSFIGKKIHGILNRPSKRKTTADHISFEHASTIGVLFTWTDQRTLEEIEAFISEVRTIKDVKTLCYNPTKEELNINFHTVNLTDLSGLGKLNSDVANEFTQSKFDFLFHLDFELNEITQSILSNSAAKCRMGIHSTEGESYYEMMIGINQNAGLTNFAQQILKYAKGIK